MTLRTFIVERDIPEMEIPDQKPLSEAVAKLTEAWQELGPTTQWLDSYVADNKTFGIYLAPDEYILREQAKKTGFPVSNIWEIAADEMVGTISMVRGITSNGSSIQRPVFCTGGGNFSIRVDGPIAAAELLTRERDQLLRIRAKYIGGLLVVEDIQVLGTLTKHIRPAVGVQPWIVLLCRFADSPGSPPESNEWFENLVSDSRPGLRHFFKDVSYGALDTTFNVVGWRTLPETWADYPSDEGLLGPCTDLYPEVDFTQYYGVITVVDRGLKSASGLGTGRKATIHGHKQFWGLVWLGTSGWRNPAVWAQEMGHTYGLKHTLLLSDPLDRSGWDFMGTVVHGCIEKFQGGCLPQHTTAYHKDRLGWLNESRSLSISTTHDQLRLASLSNSDDDGVLYAEVNIPSETDRYYAVEARHRSGYDQNLPLGAPISAVVIHEIDQTRNPESYTVGHGADDTNGAGGAWTAGETFVGDGVQIDILRESGNGFDIRVTFAPRPPNVRLEYAGCRFGWARYLPVWSAQSGDVVTSFQVEMRYNGSSTWVSLPGRTVIVANSNQRVYLRVKACNALGCSSYASASAKRECTAQPL